VIIKKWELAFSYVFHHCTTLLNWRTLDFELRNANFCYFKAQPFKVICVQVFFDCFENNKVHNLQFAFWSLFTWCMSRHVVTPPSEKNIDRLCIKYLLWVLEGIGGYRKWRSIVYIYGFEKGYRKLTQYEQVLTISIQNRVSEILEGYRKCTNGIRNIRRVSEMYEGYRKIKKLNVRFQ
jgi:hypothetical protein